MNTSVFLITS